MDFKKVIYQFGNNDIFDYYILDKKEDALEEMIDEESIAFKMDGPGVVKISKYGSIRFGNFDYLLEKRKKGTNIFCGYSLALQEEIVFSN